MLQACRLAPIRSRHSSRVASCSDGAIGYAHGQQVETKVVDWSHMARIKKTSTNDEGEASFSNVKVLNYAGNRLAPLCCRVVS